MKVDKNFYQLETVQFAGASNFITIYFNHCISKYHSNLMKRFQSFFSRLDIIFIAMFYVQTTWRPFHMIWKLSKNAGEVGKELLDMELLNNYQK